MSSEIFSPEPGATPISPEEGLDLIPSIATKAELNALERHGINKARVWGTHTRVLRRKDLLTDDFARELHRRMFSDVWRWAGKYRTTAKTLGWEPHRITEGVRIAFDDAAAWERFGTYPVAEAALRLHHRLALIHPWSNGNGRHARLMADIWCAARHGPDLSWGAATDLQTPGTARARYIAAMRAADAGDFAALLEFARS